jgi:GNAT superfamily N-acetyltransferase
VIRRAETAADLDVYARVWSEVNPDTPISGQEVQRRLAEWHDGRQLFLAEADGQAVGTGFASRSSTPGRAAVVVAVSAAYRGRGIGSALLDASLGHARDLGQAVASGSIREATLPWVERRGFTAYDREVVLVLDLDEPPPPPAVPDGVEIGLLTEDDLKDAYRIYAEGVADIPSVEPLQSSFEHWRGEAETAPLVLVARDGSHVVGYAHLERRTEDVLGHEPTAVARTHRRRGIGRALKQAQIAWAAERGYRLLITDTHWANEATRRLNESLGYQPQPPRILVRKELS